MTMIYVTANLAFFHALGFAGVANSKAVAEDYRRDLDLDQAVARVRYEVDGVRYLREIFSSPVDEAIVVRISADQPGKVEFDAALKRQHHAEIKAEGGDMVVSGEADAVQLTWSQVKLEVADDALGWSADAPLDCT